MSPACKLLPLLWPHAASGMSGESSWNSLHSFPIGLGRPHVRPLSILGDETGMYLTLELDEQFRPISASSPRFGCVRVCRSHLPRRNRQFNATLLYYRHAGSIVGFYFCVIRPSRVETTPSTSKKKRMESEKELIEAFERMMHHDFPNPDRRGCPGRDELRLLAEPSSQSRLFHLLEHIRRCAPCFDELKELRKTRA